MALQGICKSLNAEVTKEFAKFAEFYIEALCFNEDAEVSDPVLYLCLRHLKSGYKRVFNLIIGFPEDHTVTGT